MVAAHIHIVALALAVSAVRVGRGDEEARLCRVGDLELHLVARLGPPVPVFRDLDELAAGRVVHDHHAAPRHTAVKGRGTVAVVYRRNRVGKARRVVRAAPRGCGGAVPDRAVGLGILERHGVLLHLVHRHRLRVGLAIERAGHVPGAVGGDVEVAHARRRGLLQRRRAGDDLHDGVDRRRHLDLRVEGRAAGRTRGSGGSGGTRGTRRALRAVCALCAVRTLCAGRTSRAGGSGRTRRTGRTLRAVLACGTGGTDVALRAARTGGADAALLAGRAGRSRWAGRALGARVALGPRRAGGTLLKHEVENGLLLRAGVRHARRAGRADARDRADLDRCRNALCSCRALRAGRSCRACGTGWAGGTRRTFRALQGPVVDELARDAVEDVDVVRLRRADAVGIARRRCGLLRAVQRRLRGVIAEHGESGAGVALAAGRSRGTCWTRRTCRTRGAGGAFRSGLALARRTGWPLCAGWACGTRGTGGTRGAFGTLAALRALLALGTRRTDGTLAAGLPLRAFGTL